MSQPENNSLNLDRITQRLDDLAQGYQWAQVLFCAVKAELFSHTQDWSAPEAVAASVGWNVRATRMLLDALATQALLEKSQGQYRNTPAAAQCLVPGAPEDQTHILRHKAYGWDTWGQLDASLASGKAVNEERKKRSDDELRAFICGMADIGRQSAKKMLALLDLSPYTRMLDVGAGPGTYAIAFCQAHPAMQATLFDLEEVLPITREEVEAAGVQDRMAYQAGDLTQDAFKQHGHDLILLSNIIHSYGPETNLDLIKRCYDGLKPGGLLIVKDFLVPEEATEPAFSFLFALHMLVHTGDGDVYTWEQVIDWARGAGFANADGQVQADCHALSAYSRLCCITKPA